MRSIITSLLSVIIIFPAFSQNEKVLTFTEAIKIALQNNVTIGQAMNQQYANKAQMVSSIASIAPSISANAGGYRIKGNQFIEQEGRSINDAETNNFDASIEAQMIIFSGFERHYRISSADAIVESQFNTINRTKQDVIRNVSNQYLQVLLDQELLVIALENLETQKTQLDQLSIMVELGSRAVVDQMTQEAVVKQAEVRVLRARNTLLNDKMQLSQLLLLDPENDFTLIEPVWENTLASGDMPEEELLNIALINRGDYKASIYNEKATKFNYKVAKSDYFPTIAAFYRTGSFYSNASTREFEVQFDANQRTTYGLSLNIPIFNGLQRYSNSVQAKVLHLNAELRTKELNTLVKSQVILAVQNYKDAILNFEAVKTSLEASELSYELEEERFNLGVTNLVQYAQANQSLVQAKSDFAQAKYTLAFQDILMKYALGTLSPEDIPN